MSLLSLFNFGAHKRSHEDADTKEVRHFRLIHDGVAVQPILAEIQMNAKEWYSETIRQDTVPAQRETNSIALRKKITDEGKNIHDSHTTIDTKFAALFPHTMTWMQKIADELQGELSAALIVRLEPKGTVYGHTDFGEYYTLRDRYHLVLQSETGSLMISGGETVRLWPGELWWFDNKAWHEAHNESDEWRIHLIFDLLPHTKRAA